MLTVKQGIRLSALIDKLGLKINNPKSSEEEIGADLMMQVVSKAHLAESEIYAFIAEAQHVTVDEAADVDLIAFIGELFSDPNVKRFFSDAAKSKLRG
jgi:hypothetical protein